MTAPAGPAVRRPGNLVLWVAGAFALSAAGLSAFLLLESGSETGAGAGSRPAATTAASLPKPMSSERAHQIGRRITVIHDDLQSVWRHYFRTRLQRPYAPPELVLYSRNTPTPCADPGGATGPFYCEANRTASFDLVFFQSIAPVLGLFHDQGSALLIAQIASAHVQSELGILRDAALLRTQQDLAGREATEMAVAVQADCLAGVWANRAGARIGEVPPGRYAEVIAAARTTAEEMQKLGSTAPGSYATYGLGEIAAREAGFAAGYATGELRDCLAEGLGGNLR